MGPPKRGGLTKAFKSFRPSSKDAISDMSPEHVAAIMSLEREHQRMWFPYVFPNQQLLGKKSEVSPPKELVSKMAVHVQADVSPWRTREIISHSLDEHEEAAINQKLAQLMESLNERQQRMWVELNHVQERCGNAGGSTEQDVRQMANQFQDSLSEDQKFLFGKAITHEQVIDAISRSDVNPDQFSCLHMWQCLLNYFTETFKI